MDPGFFMDTDEHGIQIQIKFCIISQIDDNLRNARFITKNERYYLYTSRSIRVFDTFRMATLRFVTLCLVLAAVWEDVAACILFVVDNFFPRIQ